MPLPMPHPHPHVHQSEEAYSTESPTSTEESLPNPNVSVEGQGQLDERSLNVLAAREISKQIGMSGSPLSPPSLPFAGRKSVSPRPSFTPDTPPSNNNSEFDQDLTPPAQSIDSAQNRDATPTPDPQGPPLSHSTSVDSAVSEPDPIQVDDAYHTPPEYLRNFSTPPSPPANPEFPLQVQIPRISPTLPPASTPTTAKKISAAAFRRPGMRGLSNNVRGDSFRQDSLAVGFLPSPGRSPSREIGDNENIAGFPDDNIAPLNLRKKSLPSVPGPPTNLLSGPRDQGAARSVSSPFPNLRASEEQQQGPGRIQPLSNSPESRPRELVHGDEEFDYVSAYLDEDDRRKSAIHNGATNMYDYSRGGPGTDS